MGRKWTEAQRQKFKATMQKLGRHKGENKMGPYKKRKIVNVHTGDNVRDAIIYLKHAQKKMQLPLTMADLYTLLALKTLQGES
jgi:hypothetical protein